MCPAVTYAKMSCYDRGFRLNDAVSECSMRSKARIDSLFEDTRSICSSSYGDLYGSIYGQTGNLEDVNLDAQKKINGAVQARIEAMFASVEAEAGEKGECAAAILPVIISITSILQLLSEFGSNYFLIQ